MARRRLATLHTVVVSPWPIWPGVCGSSSDSDFSSPPSPQASAPPAPVFSSSNGVTGFKFNYQRPSMT
ncbi:unnamed protein product [Urochloa humidicola]